MNLRSLIGARERAPSSSRISRKLYCLPQRLRRLICGHRCTNWLGVRAIQSGQANWTRAGLARAPPPSFAPIRLGDMLLF